MDTDLVKIIGSILGGTFALCGLLMWGAFSLDRAGCEAKSANMGFQQTWGILAGCMIQVHGQWIPIESYKTFQ